MGKRDKLNQFLKALNTVKPNVNKVDTRPPMNNLINEEIARELFLEDREVKRKEQLDVSYELWRILEDIDRANTKDIDNEIFRQIVSQLAEKRHLYMNETEIHTLESDRVLREEDEKGGTV